MSHVVVTGGSIEEIAQKVVQEVQFQMESRAYRGANEMRNSAVDLLRGARSGRIYGGHQASAPGEMPAAKTSTFRNSWDPYSYAFGTSYISRIKNGVKYAGWLENGTPGGQMAPRPHHERIAEHAKPKIIRIYDEPYF